MMHKPDAHQSEFTIQNTKSSNSFLLIPMVHKHFENGILVGLEVNLDMESSLNRKLDAMCKNQLLPKMAKNRFYNRPSHCSWLLQIHARSKQTCMKCKQPQKVAVSMFPKSIQSILLSHMPILFKPLQTPSKTIHIPSL